MAKNAVERLRNCGKVVPVIALNRALRLADLRDDLKLTIENIRSAKDGLSIVIGFLGVIFKSLEFYVESSEHRRGLSCRFANVNTEKNCAHGYWETVWCLLNLRRT